jgi:hypothetical protein
MANCIVPSAELEQQHTVSAPGGSSEFFEQQKHGTVAGAHTRTDTRRDTPVYRQTGEAQRKLHTIMSVQRAAKVMVDAPRTVASTRT